ncbi:MAG: class I SAM-dependent methyltransferase [Acidobacteriota bacterium]
MASPGRSIPPSLEDAFFAALPGEGRAIDRAIHRDDEMLQFLRQALRGDMAQARGHYFRSGHSIAEALLQILRWRYGGLSSVPSLLDFASGYGRVTRFLAPALGAERVWVSDLYEAGIEFQRQTFGVRGFVSTVDPADLDRPERFAVIVATSLFSHLREERFHGWLQALGRLLESNGMLIFSVHDQSLLPTDRSLDASGLTFQARSESGSHDPQEYGSAWVSEDFVRRAVEGALGEVAIKRLPHGLCAFQDLYVVTRPGDVGSPLEFAAEPKFHLERCDVDSAGLELAGWTGGEPAIEAVEATFGGARATHAAVALERPEAEPFTGRRRCGWQMTLPLPDGFTGAHPLLLRTVDAEGRRQVVHLASVATSTLGCAEERLRWLQEELHRRETRWATDRDRADARHGEDQARSAQTIRELEARIAAMEASRFWKLRNLWFRLKGGGDR